MSYVQSGSHSEHFWMHNYGTHDLSDYEYIAKSTYDGSFPQLPTVKTCFDHEKITFVIDGQLIWIVLLRFEVACGR